MTNPNDRIHGNDEIESASTLLNAGIESYQRNNWTFALIYLGISEKIFNRRGDYWNAQIARDWSNAVRLAST